ncbi:hypothetical protein SIN8267_02202 [Sinobacterium norvegicum]|uniref:HTH tetR-type domain-containing protein n=1 Tax=Sinobacterium norvegicum TaxID=1641715 RepID=A0ABM9AFV9_9GAMM|nr:TetR/AcrR family transcriptional regulator [Sinobacterium norvegicum]CAH0992087.1 hypothetical protein SIN8267_02202 [Sinobacterium norvegicum]
MGRPRVRDKIIVAAQQLLASKGASALTTKAVASEAGVTEASLFNNFGDKAGLIRVLIEEQAGEFSTFEQALLAGVDGSFEDWLAAVLMTARDYFSFVLPLAAPQLLLAQSVKQQGNSYTGHRPLASRLSQLQQQGWLPSGVDVEATALLIMGAAMHSALTGLTMGDDALGGSIDSWARRIASSLVLPIG